MRGASGEIFTARKLRKQGRAPEAVLVAISALKREFREINRRTEVGSKWTDKGVEQVGRLQAEARINKMRREC